MDMMHTICLRCGKPAVSISFHYDELGMKLSYTHYSYCEKCLRDGLKVLKEQEPVKPTINESGEAYCICGENVGIIPNSKNLPKIRLKYCSECGRRMKWE